MLNNSENIRVGTYYTGGDNDVKDNSCSNYNVWSDDWSK